MPRRKSRKHAKSTVAIIVLIFQAITAIISVIALAIVAYYKWATKITQPKRRIAAYLAPVCLVALLAILGSATTPAEPTFEPVARTAPQPAYKYDDQFESTGGDSPDSTPEVEPTVATQPQPSVEPEPEVPELEPVIAPEPITTGTGFVSGTCKDLKAQGLGPFYPGDANYTNKRDRDNDGIACE